MKKLLSLLLAFTLILGTTFSVSAATVSEPPSLEKCIKVNESGYLYLSDEVAKMDFNEEQVNAITNVLNAYNTMIDNGFYTLKSVNEVVPTEKYYQIMSAQAKSGGGKNYAILIPPSTWKVAINDEVCKMITTGLDVGSIFVAFIPNPVAAVTIAATIVLYGNTINNTNKGNGVIFKMNTSISIPYDFQPQ